MTRDSSLSIRRGPQHYKYFFHVWNTDLNLKLFPLLGIYFAGCVDGAI
jgi:hypothetical protein